MAVAAACVTTMGTMGLCSRTSIPTASFSLLSGSSRGRRVSLSSAAINPQRCCSPLLHSSFVTASSISLSSRSSFSGMSLGVDMNFSGGAKVERSYRLVVRAKKFLLCQTKRNRSRKSLARTHGFKVRMSTTSGRAVLKRRRAKGRWILCTKTNHNSGKRP